MKPLRYQRRDGIAYFILGLYLAAAILLRVLLGW